MRRLALMMAVLAGLALAQQVTGGGGSGNATKLQGVPVSNTAPGNGTCLVYNSGTGSWQASNCAGTASTAWNALTSGTNTAAAMVVGTGASLAATGSGTIAATSVPAAGLGVGTIGNSTSGNAATATALATSPTTCAAGSYATGILASGNATGCTVAATGELTPSSKSASYTLVSSDFGTSPGKLISFGCSAICLATLPSSAPAVAETVSVVNSGPYALILTPNGLGLNGIAAPISLGEGQGATIASDGSAYVTLRGAGTPNGISRRTITGSSNNERFNYSNSLGSVDLASCEGSGTTDNAGAYPENPAWMLLKTDTTPHTCYAYVADEGDAGTFGNATHPTLMDFKAIIGICSGIINPANAGTNACTVGASTTNIRVWFGFIAGLGQNIVAQGGTDTLWNTSGAGDAAFRYSTSASDTTVKCVTVDSSGTQHVADTGFAPDASFHSYEILADDIDSKVFFLRDGAVVCGGPVTSNVPFWNGTGTPNAPFAGTVVASTSTPSAEVHVGPMSVSSIQ
jgi:hypothetical protein